MALTLPAYFSKAAAANRADMVALVHLYYSAGAYHALATHPVNIGTVQYKAIVDSIGTWGAQWNLTETNNVALNIPEVRLKEYTAPDGYSLQQLFGTTNFSGRKIEIYIGYNGGALADYLKVLKGIVDDVTFPENAVTISIRPNEIPDNEIQGAKLTFADNKIGGTTYSGVTVPEESDQKYLPVPFGNHWNAPIILYDNDSSHAGRTSWCSEDTTWYSGLNNAAAQARSRYRHNTLRTECVVYIPENDFLVPLHATGYREAATLAAGQDSRVSSIQRILVYEEGVSDQMFGQTALIFLPLKFDYLNYGAWTYGSVASHDTESNIYKAFDGTASTTWQAVAANGTTAHYIGNGSAINTGIQAYVDHYRNLRSDYNQCIHPLRPIHVPDYEYSSGSSDFFMLVLGHWTLSNPGYLSYILLRAYKNNAIAAGNEIGQAYVTQGNGTTSYNFCSAVRLNRGGDTSFHLVDLFTSSGTDFVGFVSGVGYGIADTGNYAAGTPASAGEFPFIPRRALDSGVKVEIEVHWNGSGSDSQTIVLRDLGLEAVKTVDFDWSQDKYTELVGIKLTAIETLYSRPSGTSGVAQVTRPHQYIETLLRAKGGAVDADFNSAEWLKRDESFTEMFGTNRDGSGFVITQQHTLDKFLREYIKYEPYSLYRDAISQYRMPTVYRDADSITDLAVTVITADFKDFSDVPEFGLTPSDKIVAEIKHVKTDYVYNNESYVNDIGFRLPSASYSFAFWDSTNTVASNRFFLDAIEKPHTSSPACDRVTDGGVCYGCIRSGTNLSTANTAYWRPLAGTSAEWGSPAAWSNSTYYRGTDQEPRWIATRYLNQWGNRHRTVKFKSKVASYHQIEVGDVVQFSNVPYTLLGMTIKGFNGDTSTLNVAVNGQDCFYYFNVTAVSKNLSEVTITCMQMHDLDAYTVDRIE